MEQQLKISNGPYLMGLAATHVFLAWETEEQGDFTVFYDGETGEKKAKVSFDKEPPCRENPAGCCLYTAALKELVPGTRIGYRICIQGKELLQGSFRTPAEHPEALHIVTLSDSHMFNASREFAEAVRKEQPDFIIHGGDIPPGTGYQHVHYSRHWFQKIPEILREVPVYYIPGNHDDGPFFDSFFGRPQSRALHAMQDGRVFSFAMGPDFFLFVDSNPWGLLEMNAVNSGVELPEGERKHIAEILSWLENELQSPQARSAQWRILVAHHPYTDAFNNKYLVPLAERCGVELVIGGHLHYYVKAISSDPAIGAKTVYVCQGSAQDPEAKLTESDGEKRLLEDFPEVTAMGRNNYGVLDITEKSITYDLYGFADGGGSCLVDRVQLEQDTPSVEYTGIDLRRLDNNGHVEVRVQAHNLGEGVADARIRLLDNGEEHVVNLFGSEENSQLVLLKPGEKRRLTAVYHAAKPGEHELESGGKKLHLSVYEPSQLSFANMRLRAGKGEEADCVTAGVEATNNLDH
ncbi:MAG: metallophosphoesterase, partial [Anaerovibrio sp.]|nr:metallophosphoesterase [Anaerovibrio sp.]